jgi:CheY-like chemotaxis protein
MTLPSTEALTPSWSAKRVLLVQPRDVLRAALGSSLRRHGYVVLDAASAKDALDYVQRGVRIDVVLVELAGDELSGPELVRRLRLFAPAVRTIFVGASRHNLRDGMLHSVTIAVPFGVSELLAALSKVVGTSTS